MTTPDLPPPGRERAVIAYGEPWRGRLLEEPLGPGESLRRLHTAVRARYGRHPHLPELVRTLIEEHAGIEYLAADEGRGGPYWFGRCLCHEDDGAPTMELIDAGLLPYPQDPPGLRPWGIDPEESIWLLRPGSQIAEDLGWMLHLGEREITLKARDRREHDRFTPVLTVRLDEDPAWRMLIQIADACTYAIRALTTPAALTAPAAGIAANGTARG